MNLANKKKFIKHYLDTLKLGNVCALLLGFQLGHQLGHMATSSLRLKTTLLLWCITHDGLRFVVALWFPRHQSAAV